MPSYECAIIHMNYHSFKRLLYTEAPYRCWRNQILDTATKVFAGKGFNPATIKEIAREACIADGDFSKFTEGDFRTAMIWVNEGVINHGEERHYRRNHTREIKSPG